MSATDATPETTPAPAAVETAQLGIEGMHCASCVARVERELQSVPGVLEATVNLGSEEARVSYVPAAVQVAQLEQAIERAGYKGHQKAGQPAQDDLARQDRDRAREYRTLMRKFWFSAAVAVPVLLLSNAWMVPGLKDVSWLARGSDGLYWVWRGLALLTLPVLVWAASQFFTSAWQALRHRGANMHTLIATGITAAYLYSLVAVADPGIFPAEQVRRGVLRRRRGRHRAGRARHGAGDQGQGPLLAGDPQADRPAGQDRARDPRRSRARRARRGGHGR